MDVSDPTRAVTPTLDGPILAVLAAAGRPLTVGEIAAQSVRGSEIGIRRSIARLVEQGTVRATLMGRNQVHELNRDHIAAGLAELMADLRLELWRRLRVELASWQLQPVYAAVFGSAARGDGDTSSDIDVLLVHPPMPGERVTRKAVPDPSVWAQLRDSVAVGRLAVAGTDAVEQWHSQVDRLRDLTQRWTGNALQVVDISLFEWLQPGKNRRQLLTDVRRDGIEVARSDLLPASALSPLTRA